MTAPKTRQTHIMKTQTTSQPEIKGSYITSDGKAQIDFGITYRNGYPEFHASGFFDGSSGQCLERIKNAYDLHYSDDLREIIAWWHARHLKEVTPQEVEFVAKLAQRFPFRSFYDTQAETFLAMHGLKLRITLSDSKPAPWEESKTCHTCNGTGKQEKGWPMWHPGKCGFCNGTGKKQSPSGHHYRVTLSAPGRKRVTFDFWDSVANAEKGTSPTAYDVLACISGDAYCLETFADFCAEYGYDEDSIKALQTWKRCHSFARRLRAFFTPAELAQLSEIQ